MVEKSIRKPSRASQIRRASQIQGTSALDILLIVVVILTVLGFVITMVFSADTASTAGSTNTTARSVAVSSNNTQQSVNPYVQPTFAQPNSAIQGRAGFAGGNSVTSDINANAANLAAVGAGVAGVSAFATNAGQNNVAYGISNGEVISLTPIQPLATPYVPTIAPNVTGRSVATSGNTGNAVINIDTIQAYRPQNQELIMDQACINEIWQRNPFVIRSFANLSVRLSATNLTSNGNMRTYSFNLNNSPTGNGALCTVTTDGYVTAVSFY